MSEEDDFLGLFAPEPDKAEVMAGNPPWKVLLVDDEADIHAVLRLALQNIEVENRALQLLDARSATEAKIRLTEHSDIALILLDVVMETEQAGLELVRYIRNDLANSAIQIVLVTGQPGYAPQREVVVGYEINGYRLKSELTTDKIFVSVCTALRSYRILRELEQQQQQLEIQTETLQAQQHSLSRWGHIFEHAEWGIVVGGTDGKHIELANPAFARQRGYNIEEVAGMSIAGLFTPDEAAKLPSYVQKAHELGHYTFESSHIRKDGSIFPILADVTAVKDEQGQVLYRVVNVQDITERKRIESELANYRQHLEELVAARTAELEKINQRLAETQFAMDKAGIGIHWVNADTGKFLYVNEYAARLIGLSQQELLTLTIPEVDPNFPSEDFVPRTQALRELSSGTIETTQHHKDGRIIPIEVTFYYQPEYGELPNRFISFITDISQRKKNEQALLQAKEVAEAANIAKSTFISTMSHELRTPLNAILGFSELLSHDETLSTSHKETLAIINRSGAHLLSMINDVLDISKIEAGRLELEIEGFNFPNLLQEIGDMIKVRAANNQLSFSLEIAADIAPYIKADSGKLRQILINLLGNAIKFTQHGGVILRAASQSIATDKVLLTIEVTDTGLGIPKQKLVDLFKPFVQLSRSDSGLEGTGLGLVISKSLIELMGGRISVKSVLGIGSTFKIELPVSIADIADIVVEKESLPVKSLASNQPEWRLLIVDDNADNRLLLATLLDQVGFKVREAENGQEAVLAFEQWHPALIWMDMRMPVMDGYQATRKIRQLAGGDKVKIIALTASAFTEQHQAILDSGCDAVLHKPFHAPEIFAILSQQLEIEFIYQDKPVLVSLPLVQLTPEILNKLPQELIQQLYEAAQNLDMEETDALIAQIQNIKPEIADALKKLAQNFQFGQIIRLIETTNSLT
jgi:PAS domain S-box-containing protein